MNTNSKPHAPLESNPTLTSFSFENYRAFARKQVFDVKPLTLVFGWNSGGKSALIRFLPLLSESINFAGPYIWLSGEVGRRAPWTDLVCKTTGKSTLNFGLNFSIDSSPDKESIDANWGITGDAQGRWQDLRAFNLAWSKDDGNDLLEKLISARKAAVTWEGLIPSISDKSPELINNPEAFDAIQRLRSCLQHLKSDIQWISSVRVRPPRVTTYGGAAPYCLRPDGIDAVDQLISAQLESSSSFLNNEVQRFFSVFDEELVLDNSAGDVWRLMLQRSGASKVRVNLCDTGEGYSQVLPVLVALARAQNGGPKILCLEQPELHLHTRAQVELAQTLVRTATNTSAARLLIETHSEILLTSIQLAIANKNISPEMVRVYWIESKSDGTSDAVAVDFDDLGRPKTSDLAGAFGEATQLGHQLIMKQMGKF